MGRRGVLSSSEEEASLSWLDQAGEHSSVQPRSLSPWAGPVLGGDRNPEPPWASAPPRTLLRRWALGGVAVLRVIRGGPMGKTLRATRSLGRGRGNLTLGSAEVAVARPSRPQRPRSRSPAAAWNSTSMPVHWLPWCRVAPVRPGSGEPKEKSSSTGRSEGEGLAFKQDSRELQWLIALSAAPCRC